MEYMYNWSTDERKLKKNTAAYTRWKLEQMVNFGLNGKRLKTAELKKYWRKLRLDPDRKKFLGLLLHEKHSHANPSRPAQSRRWI